MAHPDAATWRKVGVREGARVALYGAPRHWDVAALPAGATAVRRRRGSPADVVVAFFSSRAALERAAADLAGRLGDDAMLWIAWPRKAAGHVSDLGDEVVRRALGDEGLVDVKVAMLDEDWSALKFVRRREHRGTRRGRAGP